jgi:hypothetical protein
MSQCFWLQENKTAIFHSKIAGIFLLFGWKLTYFFPNREKIIVGHLGRKTANHETNTLPIFH